jgi:hypothetical protein
MRLFKKFLPIFRRRQAESNLDELMRKMCHFLVFIRFPVFFRFARWMP